MNFHTDVFVVYVDRRTHIEHTAYTSQTSTQTNTHRHTHTKRKVKMFSLGTLLMALSGRRTRTVRIADRLMFCRSSEYSTILDKQRKDKENTARELI